MRPTSLKSTPANSGDRSFPRPLGSPLRRPRWAAFRDCASRIDLHIFPQPLRTDVGREHVSFVVGRDARRAGDEYRLLLLRLRIRDERRERTVSGAADEDAPPPSGVVLRIRRRVAGIDGSVVADEDRARSAKLLPLVDEVALLVEDLDAPVRAIGHVHPSLRVDADVMRLIELARGRSCLSPGLDEPAVLRELHHAVVLSVAVGHEDVAVPRDGDTGRLIEGVGTVPGHALL